MYNLECLDCLLQNVIKYQHLSDFNNTNYKSHEYPHTMLGHLS